MIEYLERGGTEGLITDTANVGPRAQRRDGNPDHPGLNYGQSGRWLPSLTGRDRAPAPGGRPARVLTADGRDRCLGQARKLFEHSAFAQVALVPGKRLVEQMGGVLAI